jgi:hypothetical protein
MLRRACVFGILVVLMVVSASPADDDHSRPFHGRVAATWDNIFDGLFAPPAEFAGGGPVTHMGNTKQTGTLILEAPVAPGIFPGYGSVTITAANGDQLTFDYVGLLYEATGEGIGTFTFTGGTGRFEHASGGGTFDAMIDLSLPVDQPMTVVLDGRISY